LTARRKNPRLKVPFFRVGLNETEIGAVERVLRSGWLSTGVETALFEREFAAAIGHGVEAVAVNSNTAGMHLSLEALGIGPGDEVIVPVLTFTATAEVVRYLGADPVFVDIDSDTLCLKAETVGVRITGRTKAIMPVHFAGLPCDVTKIGQLAAKQGIAVVEDAAHAFPAAHKGITVGGHGSKTAVFSFYANKTITTGEGGMIVSADREILKRARIMRLHGIDRDVFRREFDMPGLWRYDVVAPGFKYNMPDIAAAIGRGQLARADELRIARERISARYDEAFANLPLRLPARVAAGDIHAHHLYIVQLEPDAPVSRDEFLRILDSQGIGYSVHYTPLHQMTYWKERYHLKDADFPAATSYIRNCVSLPLFPSMNDEETEIVIAAVAGAFR
jgi:dTDP-4-amino-4,6-dideoxygalactose transaminase